MEFSTFIHNEGQAIRKEAGEHVFLQGDSDSSLYLIKQGVVKAYYVTDEGQERVKSFLTEGDIIGSTAAAYENRPTSFGLVCLAPTVLMKFSFEKLHKATLDNHQLANELIVFLLQFAIKKEGRERELLCFTAEQRYQNLLKTQPTLIDQVTKNDIARYLGVTPVGLSRIKNRLKKERYA